MGSESKFSAFTKLMQEKNIDQLVVVRGSGSRNSEASCIAYYLIGMHVENTVLVATRQKLILVSSKELVAKIDAKSYPFSLETRTSDSAEGAISHAKRVLTGSVATVADKEDAFCVNVLASLPQGIPFYQQLISLVLQRSPEEISRIRHSSELVVAAAKFCHNELLKTIDQERTISHVEVATTLKQALAKALKKNKELLPEDVEFSFDPVVQSGGASLDYTTKSSNALMNLEVVSYLLGVRYKGYSTLFGRTIVINPTKDLEALCQSLYNVRQTLINKLLVGVTLGAVYEAVINSHPEVTSNIGSSLGSAVGVELYNAGHEITRGCSQRVLPNMVYAIRIEIRNKRTLLVLYDTVLVEEKATVLTQAYDTFTDSCFDAYEGESGFKKVMKEKQRRKEQIIDHQLQRREHQRKLFEQLISERIQFYSLHETEEPKKAVVEYPESYRGDSVVPREEKIVIDEKHNTLVLPLFGTCVPLHLSYVRNTAKSDENDLRVNLLTPGVTIGIEFADSKAHFLRSITFRSESSRVTQLVREIQEAKRNSAQKTLEESVGDPEHFELTTRRFFISEVYFRPCTGKRAFSTVEAYDGGLRFFNGTSQEVRIAYSNIRNVFLQPSVEDYTSVLHFHLKTPIAIGRRKTTEIQLYRELTDLMVENLQTRRFVSEEQDAANEREIQRRRDKYNTEIRTFSEKLASFCKTIIVETPNDDMKFEGAHNRNLFTLRPTNDCLVQLSELPFFVLELDEVEVVFFERLVMSLHHFDIAFVNKDWKKPVTHLTAVPMKYLERIMDWLDSVDLPFCTCTVNIMWQNVLKALSNDPVSFYQEGGWPTFEIGSDDEEEEEEEGSTYSSEVASESSSESSFSDDETYEESGSESESEESYSSGDVVGSSLEEEESSEEEPKKRRRMR